MQTVATTALWRRDDSDSPRFIRQLSQTTYQIMAPFGPLPDKNGAFMIKEAIISTDLIAKDDIKSMVKNAGMDFAEFLDDPDYHTNLANLVFDTTWGYHETKAFGSYQEVLAFLARRAARENAQIQNCV